MDEFNRFVEWCGGKHEAAEKLGLKWQAVHKIGRGERGVSKDVAAKILALGGRRFSLEKLLLNGSRAA